VTGPHTETYVHFGKKQRNKRQSILNRIVIVAERKFKSGKVFRRFTLRFLQKFEPEKLLLISCMPGLRYFLTKGPYPVNVEGRQVKMWLSKTLQINVAVMQLRYLNNNLNNIGLYDL
jgi:hypothetical protein